MALLFLTLLHYELDDEQTESYLGGAALQRCGCATFCVGALAPEGAL